MSAPAIFIEPLTAEAFTPFGQVIQTTGAHHYPINAGMTERFHDLASVQLGGDNPRPLISIFRGQPYAIPLSLKLVERHPQAAGPSIPSRSGPSSSSSRPIWMAYRARPAPSSPGRGKASISP